MSAMRTSPNSASWSAFQASYQKALEQVGAYCNTPLRRYRQRRWQRSGEFKEWLSVSRLPSLTMEQAISLYRASGGKRTTEFKTNPIREVRDSLDFLLYDTIKLEARFGECAAEEGAYKLAGAGKEFVSYMLCLHDPTLFAVWNSYAERLLRHLGMYPDTLQQGHLGLRYLDWLEVIQKVRQQLGVADFRAVDEFCYWETSAWRGEITF